MYRILAVAVVAAIVVVGCAQPQWPTEPPKKPAEMAKLQPFVGSWAGTAEMVCPSVEEMKKKMPEKAGEIPTSYAGAGKYEWTLDGMFLKGEGWHEMGKDQRATYIEYYTWDPKAKKFRGWYVSDWGESGMFWMTVDPDGKVFRVKSSGTDAEGRATTGEGTMTLVDSNAFKWSWTEKGPCGKMEIKGKSKRQP